MLKLSDSKSLSKLWVVLSSILIVFASGHSIDAAELPWPDRSGPTLNGHAAADDARGLPTEWSGASGKNIAWKFAFEGEGHSSPVVGEGRVWFTSGTKDGKQQFIYALDEKTGKVLHHKLLFENEDPEPLSNGINNYASPSCVLEKGVVYASFGTYGNAKLDAKTAEVIWQRRDINCRHFRGPGSSPILFDDLLILTMDGIDQQFVTALSKQTGETVWRTDRSTDYGDLDEKGNPKAEGDLRKAYGTPALVEVDGRWQIISIGSRAGFGYDARTGEEIWTFTHGNFNAAAKPTFIDDLALVNTGDRGAHQLAIRLDASTKGNINKTHIAWDRPRGNARLASPLVVDGRLYMVTDNGVCVCLDARTGEEVWKDRLGGTFVASPVFANGLIYAFNEEGATVIFKTGDTFELVARNELPDGGRASPAVANGALFLRSFTTLYKIAQE